MSLSRMLISLFLGLALAGCASSGGGRLSGDTVAEQNRQAAQVHTELGQRYMQRGQLETALEKLEKALQFDPGYVPAHTLIAILYERINKLGLAEKHYRKAASLAPDEGGVNNNLAQFLCKRGKVNEAMQFFRQAVADPFYKTPVLAYTNAGTCLLRVHRPAEAEEQLRQALAIRSNDPEALYQMARAMTQQQDYFRARAFIQRFEAVAPPRPEALLLGYTIETNLGEQEAARKYAKALRSKFPDSDQARSLQGKMNP